MCQQLVAARPTVLLSSPDPDACSRYRSTAGRRRSGEDAIFKGCGRLNQISAQRHRRRRFRMFDDTVTDCRGKVVGGCHPRRIPPQPGEWVSLSW